MADKLELILEAERRGILPEDKRALLAEARKRGIVGPPNNKPLQSVVPKVPQYMEDAQGEFNMNDPAQADRAEAIIQQQRLEALATQQEDKRLANRGYVERTGDAAAFAGSMIPRMITRGDYGLGDVIGLASKRAGESVGKAERDFVMANRGGLEAIKAAGDVSMGVPVLSSMGAPLRSVSAAARTIAASPRGTTAGAIRGAGEAIEAASRTPGATAGTESALRLPTAMSRLGRSMQSAADRIPARPNKMTRNPSATAGLPENIQTLPERLRDIQAFRELEMEPFAPATGSAGTARYARTIEEMPVIGGTVKSPKTNVELGARTAQEDIAKGLGASGDQEATGAMVQGALDRYRTAGLDDLDPNTVRGLRGAPIPAANAAPGPVRPQAVNPYQPVRAAESMSEGAAARLRDPNIAAARTAGGGGMAVTGRGQAVQNARPLGQIGQRRTTMDDLSDAQVAGIIKAPSSQTSFATRAEALYASAERKIPELTRADGSVNPNMLPTVNLGNALRRTAGEIGNQIAGQTTLRGELAKRIMNPKSNITYANLRSIRTEVGRALSNFGDFETGLDRGQLKRLYASATQDMEAGLRDLANRAWQRVSLAVGQQNRADLAVAKRADAALYEFRRADRYFRQGMERMDKFMNVLGAKTANEAVRKIETALKEKTANPAMLRSIAGVLRPEELNGLRGHIIAGLGRGRPGSKAAESIFNFNNWATDFHAIMDGPGRRFMTEGLPESAARRLDNLARVVNRMKYYEQTKNYSGSAYTGMIGGGAMAAFNPSSIPAILAAAVGMGLSGKLLTSPAYLGWQEALMKAQLKVGNTAMSNARITAQFVKRLPALAKAQHVKDPELARAMQALAIEMDSQLKAAQEKSGQ